MTMAVKTMQRSLLSYPAILWLGDGLNPPPKAHNISTHQGTLEKSTVRRDIGPLICQPGAGGAECGWDNTVPHWY